MINKIFKYRVNHEESIQMIEMPEGAEILTAQTQHNQPCIWAMVDPSKPLTKRYFEINVTGGNIPSNAERKYIGTCQLIGGAYIIHIFELIKLT